MNRQILERQLQSVEMTWQILAQKLKVYPQKRSQAGRNNQKEQLCQNDQAHSREETAKSQNDLANPREEIEGRTSKKDPGGQKEKAQAGKNGSSIIRSEPPISIYYS